MAAAKDQLLMREKHLTSQHARAVEQLGVQIDEKVEKNVAKRNRLMDSKERLFRTTVSKLLSAEEALESSLTCMVCLSLMNNPVTLVPCGHSVCDHCSRDASGGMRCGECGSGETVTGAVRNEALDVLCGKFAHRMHELAALQKSLASSSLPA